MGVNVSDRKYENIFDTETLNSILKKKGIFVLQEVHNSTYLEYLYPLLVLISKIVEKTNIVFFQQENNACKECSNILPLIKDLIDRLQDKANLEFKICYKTRLANDEILFGIRTQEDLEHHLSLEPMLENSIQSTLATHVYNTDSEFSIFGKRLKYTMQMVKEYHAAKEMMRPHITDEIDFVVVMNGRFSEQVAVINLSTQVAKKVLYFEHGQRHGVNFHFNTFQTQDVKNLGFWIRNHYLEIESRDYIRQLGDMWLTQVQNEISINPFLKYVKSKKKATTVVTSTDAKSLLFCTSSLDERRSNLPKDTNGWNSQIEAIMSLAQVCALQGYSLIIKIHPNAMNKAWRDLIQLSKIISQVDIEVIWPWDNRSVFDLLNHVNMVGTWGSSSIISAAAMKIPVFCLTHTIFSKTMKVVTFSPEQLLQANLDDLETCDLNDVRLAAGIVKNWGYSLLLVRRVLGLPHENLFQELTVREIARNRYRKRLERRYKIIQRVLLFKMSSPEDLVQFLKLFLFIPPTISTKILAFSFENYHNRKFSLRRTRNIERKQ